MNTNLDWQQYFAIAATDRSFDEKLQAYSDIAMQRFNAGEFDEFCARHLGHLDEVAHAFFGGEVLRDAIRQKVTALYPAHEVEPFTELFFDRIQVWRQQEQEG